MKQLYDTTKKLAGKYIKPERPVKDKEGKPITDIQQQRNRWVKYFEELPNRPAPMNPPDIEAAYTDPPIDVNPPTTEEIRMAVRQIKDGKAAGSDNNHFYSKRFPDFPKNFQTTTTNTDRSCYLDAAIGLAYRDEPTELYWLENMFLDAAFPQGGVGLEKVDPKNVTPHLTSWISVSGGSSRNTLPQCGEPGSDISPHTPNRTRDQVGHTQILPTPPNTTTTTTNVF
ncbi:unnamed protein product [Schistosoma mattheei]|uniref:Uncharacterized protein n=1 Tax=Schistosoma mattheei TaxID=31246 RepID=A0A183Q5X0_9TREM|nr:unnamed protein product [Schistosoma mattheei]